MSETVKPGDLYYKWAHVAQKAKSRDPRRFVYQQIMRSLNYCRDTTALHAELDPFAVMPAVATPMDEVRVPIIKAFLDELDALIAEDAKETDNG